MGFMNVFVYRVGEGQDANIHLVFAENRARADELYVEEAGLDGVDDPDFEDVDCTEYGSPSCCGSFVIFCG